MNECAKCKERSGRAQGVFGGGRSPPSGMATPSPPIQPRSIGGGAQENNQLASLVVTHKAARLARVNTHMRRTPSSVYCPLYPSPSQSLVTAANVCFISSYHISVAAVCVCVTLRFSQRITLDIPTPISQQSVGPVFVTLFF